MTVIGNPAEMDDIKFIYTIELFKRRLAHLKCNSCSDESTLYFSISDPSYKRIQSCCDTFQNTIIKEISQIVKELP